MIDQLIYTSSADHMDRQQVQDILNSAHKNNPALGVSGVLVLINTTFIQILEGPREAVQHIFDIIKKDQRHTNVQLLSLQPVAERAFADWSMAYVEKTPEEIKTLIKQQEPGEPLDGALGSIAISHEWIGDFINECQKSITD